jgi:hypothetical protein
MHGERKVKHFFENLSAALERFNRLFLVLPLLFPFKTSPNLHSANDGVRRYLLYDRRNHATLCNHFIRSGEKMAKAAWFVSFAAPLLILLNGCNTPGQKDEAASASQRSHTPKDAAETPRAPADTVPPTVPEVILEMPMRRGKMLAELVDCNNLAALLPDSLPNMKRDDLIAERAVEDSILISLAAGSYADPAGNNIEIKITDPGDLKAVAAAIYPWLATAIQSETEAGYERTISLDGYRGFERYYLKEQSGEMYLVVGERFVVEVTGYGVMSEELKNAISQIDLRKLEGMQAQNLSAK